VGASSATLEGGIYPNGLPTTYWWQYGASTAYGQQTPAQSAGGGQLPETVQSTLTLSPSTTYHYRLVAANADGTAYGYDYSLTTESPGGGGGSPVNTAAPVNTAPPQAAGTLQTGQTLSAILGAWDPAGTPSYQWQRDAGWGYMDIARATAVHYTLQNADLGAQIRVAVTETNAGGETTAISAPVGPVLAAPPRIVVSPQLTSPSFPSIGQTVTLRRGSVSGGSELVQFWRCKPRCQPIGAPGSSRTYTLKAADAAAYVIARITVHGATSSSSAWALGDIGPVRSRQVAVATVGGGAAAAVSMNAAGPLALLRSRTVHPAPGIAEVMLTVKRAPRARAPVSAWACATSGSAPPICTAVHVLGARLVTLTLRAPAADRVQVIALAAGLSRAARRPRSAQAAAAGGVVVVWT
jgi:hypothetical protein